MKPAVFGVRLRQSRVSEYYFDIVTKCTQFSPPAKAEFENFKKSSAPCHSTHTPPAAQTPTRTTAPNAIPGSTTAPPRTRATTGRTRTPAIAARAGRPGATQSTTAFSTTGAKPASPTRLAIASKNAKNRISNRDTSDPSANVSATSACKGATLSSIRCALSAAGSGSVMGENRLRMTPFRRLISSPDIKPQISDRCKGFCAF